ncbi:NAD(P)-binding domain protein [Acididesulfobacillus acetoxydans]|uniref:Capsular polysaccharide biosynthesis protein CapD n=1 Tax=Acididesulfobacillus acetoxydans TaxID=1561005 RepID=A0A8S0Y0H7_9FIRM|nr:nucleoside-diphosphate sugar epimerase/dehydratase [Acididesulfobacillus acetoxydans]CAA7603157.1 NAD(P)-binding domain protein [Acididesulfobacillus acetoxydans]CEJ07615.1 Capsular polysaccharide biosynthesis protein CapD [Acididesulfobacillus acetoxydans]
MRITGRTVMMLLVDALLINLAHFASYFLRFEGAIPPEYRTTYLITTFVSTLIYLISFAVFGLYNRLWKYASTGELLSVVFAVTVGTAGTVAVIYFTAPMRFANTVAALLWFTVLFLVGGSRMLGRVVREAGLLAETPESQKRILIVGAGDAGVTIIRELKNRNYREGRPVGFVDDAPQKQRMHIIGVKVLGTLSDIPRLVKHHSVDEIIIAMPSASSGVIRGVIEHCRDVSAEVKILPGVYDILNGPADIRAIRPVQVEDLLGRAPVKLDIEKLADYLAGECVMVTGGGGSIGSEICRQVAGLNPESLIIVGRGENSVFEIEQQLKGDFPGLHVFTEILDIKDADKVRLVFQRYKPGVVFHAAAHKHVPLMEHNPEEALKNNVLGTSILAEAADVVGVKTFVLISTDKAVNPTSIMGASKRVAEMIIQDMDKISSTRFVAVRFGNVLGSRGSVIPTFKRQIEKGGPVTITHPDMTRYFMTIPEASQLVLQAGAMAEGGEIFILDMGSPVKILDLAKELIRLSGFEPEVDIPIVVTGVRPGEKLVEELLTQAEGTRSTAHERIFVAKPVAIDSRQLKKLLTTIEARGSYLKRSEVTTLLGTVIPSMSERQAEVVNLLTG